jgi:hypothetical protein
VHSFLFKYLFCLHYIAFGSVDNAIMVGRWFTTKDSSDMVHRLASGKSK